MYFGTFFCMNASWPRWTRITDSGRSSSSGEDPVAHPVEVVDQVPLGRAGPVEQRLVEVGQRHPVAMPLLSLTTETLPTGRAAVGGRWRRELRQAQLASSALMAETSNSRVTFSLTSTPPASRAAFQLTPQSLRLTVVVPSKPMRWLPNGSTAVPVYSKSTVTGLVTPLMVRSPVTR